jgi:hypothetical protein
MQVEINEVVSTVRTVDGDALLTPQTLNRIVAAVLNAVQDVDAHRMRVNAETRVTGGVAAEQKKEEARHG